LFSVEIQGALSSDVVGQPRAVESVVRGVTRLLSGLTPVERTWCAYLFIGPTGTGRAHLVRTLARILHGREAVFTLDCNPGGRPDWWSWFVEQLTPLFAKCGLDAASGRPTVPNILVARDLECAPKAFYPTLASLLETGELALPGGRRGRLGDSLVFLTSGLCTEQIL
jgi:ATP-dependent Clp protease ATP-binding subunit ClpC